MGESCLKAFETKKLPNFDVSTSSQNSDLDQEQPNETEQKAQTANTTRATEWGLKKFDKWCEKRAIKIDLKTTALKELNLRYSVNHFSVLFSHLNVRNAFKVEDVDFRA